MLVIQVCILLFWLSFVLLFYCIQMASQQGTLIIEIRACGWVFGPSSAVHLCRVEDKIMVLSSLPFSLHLYHFSLIEHLSHPTSGKRLEIIGFRILKLRRIHLEINIFKILNTSWLSAQVNTLKLPIVSWIKIVSIDMVGPDRVFYVNFKPTGLNHRCPCFGDVLSWVIEALWNEQICHPYNDGSGKDPELIKRKQGHAFPQSEENTLWGVVLLSNRNVSRAVGAFPVGLREWVSEHQENET